MKFSIIKVSLGYGYSDGKLHKTIATSTVALILTR
jgi:hypothetical protein